MVLYHHAAGRTWGLARQNTFERRGERIHLLCHGGERARSIAQCGGSISQFEELTYTSLWWSFFVTGHASELREPAEYIKVEDQKEAHEEVGWKMEANMRRMCTVKVVLKHCFARINRSPYISSFSI